MKGKQHVLSEVNLIMICYNLRRLISIFGINELKYKLKGLVLSFLSIFELIKAFLRLFFDKYNLSKNKNQYNLSALDRLILTNNLYI